MIKNGLSIRTINIWIYGGIFGLIVFFLLRPAVDFNAYAPVSGTPEHISQTLADRLTKAGMDSVSAENVFIRRIQRSAFYTKLQDSLGEHIPSPGQLQRVGVPLTEYEATVYRASDNSDAEVFNISDVISGGGLNLKFDDDAITALTVKDIDNPLFFRSESSVTSAADVILSEVIGYEPSLYRQTSLEVSENLSSDGTEEVNREDEDLSAQIFKQDSEKKTDSAGVVSVKWRKKDQSQAGPVLMEMELSPKIRYSTSGGKESVQKGFSIASFQTYYLDEDVEQSMDAGTDADEEFVIFLIGVFVIVGLVVLVVGVRQLFQGRVELKRGMWVFFIMLLMLFLWRHMLFEQGAFDLVEGIIQAFLILNNFLIALLAALYTAVAYMGWESLARKQKNDQLHIVDGIWQGNFFFKETGWAVINGYCLTGILLGLLVLGLFGLDNYYFFYDSGFGYTEGTSIFPVLTVPLNALSSTWFIVFGQVGVLLTLLSERIKNSKIHLILGWIVVGVSFTALGRFIGTEGKVWEDFILFLILALPVYWAHERFGLLTVLIGWGAFMMMIMMLQFFGSSSPIVIVYALSLLALFLFPLILGIVASIYGESIMAAKGYVPEYEERLQRQMRFEKEIEIARESQFTLMPVDSPKLPGVEIDGFFIPSFEVGGDYFDYVVKSDVNEHPTHLTTTVIDVSGKAMKAAMNAVHTSGLMLSRIATDRPNDVLRSVNPIVFEKTDDRTFITAVIAEYDLATRMLSFANAGHCHPILKRNGNVAFLKSKGPRLPLGLRSRVMYESSEVQLQKGDVLIFYSDGFPEAKSSDNRRFGFDSTLKAIEELETDTKTSREISRMLKDKIQQFSEYQMVDDTTLVCLKVL